MSSPCSKKPCVVEHWRVELAIVTADGRDLNHCERIEAVHTMTRNQRSAEEISACLKINKRLVTKYRAVHRSRVAA